MSRLLNVAVVILLLVAAALAATSEITPDRILEHIKFLASDEMRGRADGSPELERADYAVSSNVARTVDAARQGVIDTRSCLDWLQAHGYERFGIVGTSLGSCYAFLASAHDERLRANVFNLFSLYFADAVWTGRTTHHIRQGLDGQIELDLLRDAWMAITPLSYVDNYARFPKKSLFIHASYDTTFLPKYARAMLEEVRLRELDHKSVVLPCGHHTAGKTPFQYMDAYHICSFLKKEL